MEQEVKELKQKLVEITAKQVELEGRKGVLEQEGGDIAAHKQALDRESEQSIRESNELQQQVSDGESILSRLARANQAVQQVDKLAQ
jgi:hypothetical protein